MKRDPAAQAERVLVTFRGHPRYDKAVKSRCFAHCPARVQLAVLRHFESRRALPAQVSLWRPRPGTRPPQYCPRCFGERLVRRGVKPSWWEDDE